MNIYSEHILQSSENELIVVDVDMYGFVRGDKVNNSMLEFHTLFLMNIISK